MKKEHEYGWSGVEIVRTGNRTGGKDWLRETNIVGNRHTGCE